MGSSSQQKLLDFKPQHCFLVGIDSAACVFDSMEIKDKECFIPATTPYWKLKAILKYAREAWESVNLLEIILACPPHA